MKSINEEITRIGTEVEKRCAKYRVEVEATKEDCERLPFTGLKVGDKFTKDDLKSLDSYEKFKQYFLDTNCYFEFQYLVIRFQREYKIIELITAEAVKEEIGNIEKFLKDAQEIPIKDALILGDATQSELFEYRRLSYEDYYRGRYLESKVEIKYPAIIYHQHAARVYAKCFYFKDWLEDVLKHITINEDNKSILPPQQTAEIQFSVLEWATIFYYADETKLLPESRTIKKRIEQFINKYRINTTFNYFRTQYYNAKKRINKKNDYPIDKLELIIPFLKKNYNQTVTKVENDIKFLEEEKAD